MYVCTCVRGDVCRDNNTLYITWREITFPGISMSHCAKCHRVPVKGCLLNCHNFFNGEYHDERRWLKGRISRRFIGFCGFRGLLCDISIRWQTGQGTGHGARDWYHRNVLWKVREVEEDTLDSDLYIAPVLYYYGIIWRGRAWNRVTWDWDR